MEDTFPRAGQEDGCAPVGTGWPSPVDGEQGGKWLSRVVRGGALPRSRLWAVPVPLPPSRSPLSWACGGHEAELSHKQGPPHPPVSLRCCSEEGCGAQTRDKCDGSKAERKGAREIDQWL